MKTKRLMGLTSLVLVLLIASCTMPGPTPAPTLDIEAFNLTMTASFQPASTIPPSVTPPAVQTATREPVTATPEDTGGISTPLPASTPVGAITPGTSQRPGPVVEAVFLSTKPVIDGNLGEWNLIAQNITSVVYGAANHQGSADLSGWFMLGWDDQNLYIAARVVDDVYTQNARGENLFKGDSLEFLLDKNLPADYYVASLSPDDYQLGISPGSNIGEGMEAYLWYPRNLAGGRSQVMLAAVPTGDGYQVEAAVPWDILEIDPAGGARYGYAFSISDNDNTGQNVQESMVSNVSTRRLTNPRTWGNLILLGP